MTEYNYILHKYILDVRLNIEMLEKTHPTSNLIIRYNISCAIEHLIIANQLIFDALSKLHQEETKELEAVLPHPPHV